jgi:hypothetical protein
MPVTPPEENMVRREVEAGLAADGSLTASLREHREGQSAASARRVFQGLAPSDFNKVVERWVAGGAAAGAKFTKIEPSDAHAEGRFALDVELTARPARRHHPAREVRRRARLLRPRLRQRRVAGRPREEIVGGGQMAVGS